MQLHSHAAFPRETDVPPLGSVAYFQPCIEFEDLPWSLTVHLVHVTQAQNVCVFEGDGSIISTKSIVRVLALSPVSNG